MSLGQRNFAVVWASSFITSAGMMAFLPLLPLHLYDLGVRDAGSVRLWSGVLAAAAPFPAAFMGPIWGALGDRLGRKLMMVRANLAIVLFVGAMAWAGSEWQLLGLRLGQGVFSGFIAPAMTLVSVSASDERQGRAASNLQMANIAGSIAGPLLGGLVGDAFGYRAVFLLTSLLSLTATALVALLAREPEGDGQRAPAAAGRSNPLELLQRIAKDVLGLLARPELRVVLLAAFTVRFAVSLVDPVLALFVELLDGFDHSRVATVTGIVFLAEAAATLLFTPFWGRFGDRRGARRTVLVCSAGAAVFLVAQAAVHHVVPLFLLRLGSGAFAAGVVPAAFAMASRHSARAARGGAYGVTFSSVVLGRALAPVVGGALAATVGLRALFVIAALLLLATAWAQRERPAGGAAPAA